MNVNITGVNLVDGGSVLLIAPEELSAEEAYQLKELLESKFPKCGFVILAGDFKILVAPKGEQYNFEVE